MDDTRGQIIAILQRRKQATAREVAQDLGVTEATVRRHLEILLRDLKVSRSVERGGPGRPNHVFSALGEAPSPAPAGLQRLAGGLLFEAAGLGPELGGLADGHNLAAVLVDRLAHRMALTHAWRLVDKRGMECLQEAAAALRDEGYEADYQRTGDGDQIVLARCPFGDLARRNPALCNLESRFVAGLLGAEVERRCAIAQGADQCLLAIRAARPAAPPTPGEAEPAGAGVMIKG
ncbi:MAG: winged helix-turn-helix transcriptional regulator [Chloroflexi bacterium]|nr:winged helix-turn-helix transcriptional regulator [Chloroflexota bacterium]